MEYDMCMYENIFYIFNIDLWRYVILYDLLIVCVFWLLNLFDNIIIFWISEDLFIRDFSNKGLIIRGEEYSAVRFEFKICDLEEEVFKLLCYVFLYK